MANFDNSTLDSLGGGTTKEIVYLMHILEILNKIQLSFDDALTEKPNSKGALKRFTLYVKYLESCVLDDDTRELIRVESEKERKILEKQFAGDTELINYMIGFVVVKYVMKYLNDVCQFEHRDIASIIGYPDEDVIPEVQLNSAEFDLYEEMKGDKV
jgi:hypothetical protein